MIQEKSIIITNERFSLADTDVYMIYGKGWINANGYAILGEAELNIDIALDEAANKLNGDAEDGLERIVASVRLPETLPKTGKLTIYLKKDGKVIKWYDEDINLIAKRDRNPQFYVESFFEIEPCGITLAGWAASDGEVKIEAFTSDNKLVQGDIIRKKRPDVKAFYTECEVSDKCGFQLTYKNIKSSNLKIIFTSKSGKSEINYPLLGYLPMLKRFKKRLGGEVRYLKRKGLRKYIKRLLFKLKDKNNQISYEEWMDLNFAAPKLLDAQRKRVFGFKPLISLIAPLKDVPVGRLHSFISSMKEQSYAEWNIFLIKTPEEGNQLFLAAEQYAARDSRIKIVTYKEELSDIEKINRTIADSRGEYIGFADIDDMLEPNTLYEIADLLNKDSNADIIYTDEDKTDRSGKNYFDYQMKPDFNIDLLRSYNYIGHLCVFKKSFLDIIGYLDRGYLRAENYDLILRAVERTDKICHIPRVLYHERKKSAPDKEIFEAGRRAVRAHLDRLGIKAEVSCGAAPGVNRIKYHRDRNPLVSIIIPNKDHIDDLDKCLDSICAHSTYDNYEIIVVENNSKSKETFEYYKRLECENQKAKVVRYKGEFNYSLINNFGVSNANGEYLLLLNNDTSMINPDCIEEMLGYCMRADVGAVGAKLLYYDNTIQHAGVIIGLGGIAGHAFLNSKADEPGYCDRIICAQDYSAVTAACMMVDKNAYERVKGFWDRLAVAFNDVDFCLKLREKGYLIVYDPYAQMYHYESKTRGYEDTREKQERFKNEINLFHARWIGVLDRGDPCYSPNLSLMVKDYTLKGNFS